ncbi:transcriptional regulator [Lysinibacillus sp. NPDC047702]|uniref:transcriptional regulator n=1 Tax=unclassified Lysinibacillus TaxID=2636778 RepID=UPI000D20B331|nr:transcriptional regulator [Lysinibacillus sp. B2A1]
MTDYREGYEFYKQVCEKHGLEPINFHYYILNLSQEQLDAYNEQAKALGGRIEYEIS